MQKRLIWKQKQSENVKLSLQGKVIEGVPGNERKLLVMIKHIS